MTSPADQDLFQLKFLKAIFDSTTDGLLVVNHKTGLVTARNQRFLEIFKIPKELWQSNRDDKFLEYAVSSNKAPDKFLQLVKDLYSEPYRKSTDILDLVDGRTLERQSEPVIVAGEVLGRVWYFRDITEKVKSQVQLMSSAKMATLGEMAGGIAHEVNNPLAVITAIAYQLERDISRSDFDVLRSTKKLKKIQKMVDRISLIIRSLRTFSRDGSHDPFEFNEVRNLIDETLILCQDKLRASGVNVEIAEFPLVTIEARETEIVQVITNLISNSADAIRNLDEKWIRVECIEDRNSVRIFVTDSGKGIPAHIRDKIFQPFFTTKEVGSGTGLGLSISMGIVSTHNGNIRLDESFPNTRFILELPKIQTKPKLTA